MNGFVKFSIIVSALVAILTFSVSIPVNLLGTSLMRAAIAFAFFIAALLGTRFIFHRLSPREQDETQEEVQVQKGRQIDLKTPSDSINLEDLYAAPEKPPDDPKPDRPPDDSERASEFEPLSAPALGSEQRAAVIGNAVKERRQ